MVESGLLYFYGYFALNNYFSPYFRTSTHHSLQLINLFIYVKDVSAEIFNIYVKIYIIR